MSEGKGIDLGDVARDRITGFTGVVVASYRFLHGCERLCLQPRELKDGKPLDTATFDVPQLELVEKRALKATNKTGGPQAEPARREEPRR